MTDLFTNFRPCALGADLSGTAAEIQARLLPAKDHYREIRNSHPGLEAFDIERSILRNWKREDMGVPGKYGLYWWQHFLLFMVELIPSSIITPAFVDEAIATEIMIVERCDLLNLIGAKSAGKSAWMARAALTLLAIDPEYTRVYVAAPFKNVADFTIWSEMRGCFEEIKKAHGDVFPDAKETPTAKLMQLELGQPKAGRLDLIGLDSVAKLQGTKSRDANRGFMILVADEIALFPTQDFLQVLDNVTGNKNFIGFDGCNFKSVLEMDGILCNPRDREYGDLNPDNDHIWFSAYNSITLRLDGHLSPNVLANREIYPFLLTERKRSNMEIQHGLKGPKYLEQIRSFPHHGVEEMFVLSMERLRSGGAFDKFYTQDDSWSRVAFCDPGWQGDPCKIGCFEFGYAKVQAHDGSVHRVMILRPVGPIRTLKIEAGMIADISFLQRLTLMSSGPVMLKEGREVTMDLQIAVQCAEFLHEHKVPVANFGFDSSCRGSIVQEICSVLGPGVQVYDLVSLPSEMVVDESGATAKEKWRNLRTECYLTMSLIVSGGQLREADMIMDALGQACRHRVVQAGMKIGIENKADYKKVNQGKSPDASDTLAGACHLARKRGFELTFSRSTTRLTNSISNFAAFNTIRPRPSFAKLST